MLVNCPICCVYFIPGASMTCTPCGHVFHVECIMQWFERSKTCPQCRKPANDKKIVKIYLNISDSTNDSEENQIDKIDNLNLKLRSLEKDLNETKSEKETLANKVLVNEVECKHFSDKCIALESQVSALRKHMKSQRALEDDLKFLRNEKEKSDNELKTLKSVQTVVQGTVSEADEAMLQNCDGSESSRTLVTMTSALKRNLSGIEKKLKAKIKELESQKQGHQASLREIKAQHEREIQEINQLLKSVEKENESLKKKMKKMQVDISSPNNSQSARDKMLSRLLHESPMPEEFCLRSRFIENARSTPELVILSSPDSDKPSQSKTFFTEPTSKKDKPASSAVSRQPMSLKQTTTKPAVSSSTSAVARQPLPKKHHFATMPGLSKNAAGTKPNLVDINKPSSLTQSSSFSRSTSSLFGSTRVSRMASNESLHKRLYAATQCPPDGMVYNGLGGTVRADHPIAPKRKYFTVPDS